MLPASAAPALLVRNWRALQAYPRVLVRRTADRDEWVIAASQNAGPTFPEPRDPGAWVGQLSFDHASVRDRIAQRGSRSQDGASSAWWQPELLIVLGPRGADTTGSSDTAAAEGLLHLLRSDPEPRSSPAPSFPLWTSHTTKERYLTQVALLQRHIQRGDIYEVNYCTERTADLPGSDPFEAFARLLERTDAPFAAFHRSNNHYVLCMSPERFLRVEGDHVLTQPMKGTRKRSPDPTRDAALIAELTMDPKERSENIMAVDVARHDLSRVAASGSVRVEELCVVKSYPNVHQLVSTVSARLRNGTTAWDAVRAAFPMASMTGAPKLRALELIDAVEDMPRGLFSGSIGYQLPGGILDLNVVIRTITFDASTGKASLITGSAITALSDPEGEWEECELKARSVMDALL